MITDLRKEMVERFINQNYCQAIQTWCNQNEKTLIQKAECLLDLSIDFHTL